MKYFDWNKLKNEKLKKERGVSFEDMLNCISDGNVLDVVEHRNSKKYPNQKIFIIAFDDYAYLVPFVEDDKKIFLKTIIPSRQATKKYLIYPKSKQ